MSGQRIFDGLTKVERYRLKDVDAYRKRKREWASTDEQREIRNAYMRVWRSRNRQRHNELSMQSHHRNKWRHVGKSREYMLRVKYGITSADYERMMIAQNYRCLICETDKPARKRFHVDHDHVTGRIRGLLCSRCNGALGWFEKYRGSIIKYGEI